MIERTIAATIHGRYLVETPPGGAPAGTLVGCHGYAQPAEAPPEGMPAIPGAGGWRPVARRGRGRAGLRGMGRRVVYDGEVRRRHRTPPRRRCERHAARVRRRPRVVRRRQPGRRGFPPRRARAMIDVRSATADDADRLAGL